MNLNKERRIINMLRNGTDQFHELAALYVGALLVAGTLFSIFEHVDFFNSMWWAVVTALTIGYGDLYPHTVAGKIVAVILMHFVTLFIIPIIIGRMAKKIIESK